MSTFFVCCLMQLIAVARSQFSENEELRQEFDVMAKTFDNLNRDLVDRTETNEGDIAQMLATFTALREHINEILQPGIRSEINEIVELSKNREYDKVKSKISRLNDSQLWRIVREIYSSSNANFDIIVELSQALAEPQSTKIIGYLYKEMLINYHRDPHHLEILYSHSTKFDDKDLKSIQNSLVTSLKDATVVQLKMDSIDQKLYDLHKRIFTADPSLFERLARQTITSVYNKVELIKIMEYIDKYEVEQKKISARLLKDMMVANKNFDITEETAITILKLSQILEGIDFDKKFIDALSKKFNKAICLELFDHNATMFFDVYEKFLKTNYITDKETILEKTKSLENKEIIDKALDYLYLVIQNEEISEENVLFFLKYNDSNAMMADKLNLKTKIILKLKELKSERILTIINEYDQHLCANLMYDVIDATYGRISETLEYIKKQQNLRLRLTIYSALFHHMKLKNDTILKSSTIVPILKIKKAIENLPINELDFKLKDEKRELMSKLPNFEHETKETFKTYILTLKNSEILGIIDQVFLYDRKIYEDILNNLINEVYGNIKIDWILKNIFKLKYIEEYIIGCEAVFIHLEKNGDVAFKIKTVKDLFELKKSVENISKMKNYRNINISYKEKLSKLKIRLPDVYKMSKEKIIHDLSFYDNMTEIAMITNQIAKDGENFVPIMNDVFKATYGKADVKKIIQFTKSLKYIESMIECYVSVVAEVEKSRRFHDLIDIGIAIKELISSSNFLNVKSQYKDKIKFLIFKLPVSIRNLIFSQKVCLKSKIRNEFVFFENDHYKFDKARRTSFTLVSKGINVKSYFNIIKHDDKFLIKNSYYEEYLYASLRYFETGFTRRMVFSDVDKSFRNESLWTIEPHGDYCFLKNSKYNEYLYSPVDKYKRDDIHRWIFTYVPQTKDESSLWKIVDCSDF